MNRKIVRAGLSFLILSIILVTVTAFTATLFSFFWGMFIGGMAVILICIGLVTKPSANEPKLFPFIIVLLLTIFIFFCISFYSITAGIDQQEPEPGETITI
ncbi:MAG: hypothetical protein FWD70_02770 [Desulfuromonadales bacterium]|nr:hypothetical protein [Desulfuromonadales bacterium]